MKKLLSVMAVALLMGATGPVNAQAPGRHTANIALSTNLAGFILGAIWGSGTVTMLNGRSFELRLRTLKVGMAGLESVRASGRVYNLDPRRPEDIEGNFASMGAGVTIAGGVGVQRMKNEKGVIIELNETAQGFAAKIAASGMAVMTR